MAVPDLQKALSDQVLIRYQCFCFFELFIFIYGFSTRSSELRIFCLKEAMKKLSGNDGIFHIFFYQIFQLQGYHCKSDIANFTWKYTSVPLRIKLFLTSSYQLYKTFRSTLQKLWNNYNRFPLQQTNQQKSLIFDGNVWPN